ncbi:ysdA [Acrasis kona]|uniref:YsdA n=1 Tax=Acrasis kona TaxID=1008807 RepID=A0AAW2YH48_9EUKA
MNNFFGLHTKSALARSAVAYLAAANLGSAGLFYYDKQQAIQKKWRVPEKTLCATALAGGWVGGYFAIEKFRHKNKKPSFMKQFNAAVALNVGLAALAVFIKKPLNFTKLWIQNRRKF